MLQERQQVCRARVRGQIVFQSLAPLNIYLCAAPPRCQLPAQSAVLKGHGAHELRARHGREPWVNAASPDLEGGALWQQVANVAQEILVGGHLQRLARGVVVVDLLLQTVALVQERLVLGRVLQDEPPKGAPKLLGVDPRAGEMSFSTSRTSFMSTFRPPLSSVLRAGPLNAELVSSRKILQLAQTEANSQMRPA
jgi:hypothetical protein